ncbi:BMC domain-containing protein [Pediococcus acidilactici]|uniref:BMC domain-containing protein n=1 Tax=Pediococcus acidilactici TaxID=1254 RepID=UPI001CCC9C5D|nr:BMC domain-containing protein [Pediococcus acidilactici]
MKTLGYLEVKGLTNAIVSADKMLKTADVELKNISNTRGSGWVTVAIVGDVAAVSVAIAMAKEMMGENYVSSTVLANPAEGIEKLNRTDLLLEPTVRKANEANSEPLNVEPTRPTENWNLKNQPSPRNLRQPQRLKKNQIVKKKLIQVLRNVKNNLKNNF